MILSGLLTMTMIYAALAPEAALRSTFGESVSGPVADIVMVFASYLLAVRRAPTDDAAVGSSIGTA
jgi:hypothetical protein